MKKSLAVEILDAAVMVRDAKSRKLTIKEAAEFTPRKGAVRGAIAGGIIGLIFPPAILALGAVGAAAGAAVGHFTDQGFDNNLLKEIGENLPPGGSAIIAVVEEVWVDRLSKILSDYAELSRYTLEPEAAAKLTAKIKR